jgi:hypothetical protein
MLAELGGLADLALAEQRVELEQQGVHDFVVGFGEIEREIAHVNGFVEVRERMDVDFGRVQHGLEIGIVERDRLAVVLDGFVELALERRDVAEQVVGLGRLAIDLERPPCGHFRATRVSPLYEVPTSIEVSRELVHSAR